MASLFASMHALEILTALEQRDGLRLSELAQIVRVSVSSVQKALSILVREGLVMPVADDARRYRLAVGEEASAECLLSHVARRSPGRFLDVVVRASPAVEFAGRTNSRVLIVKRWDAEPADEVRLARGLDRISGLVAIESVSHDTVRDRLRADPGLARRLARCQVITGTIARSFPDPRRHGSPEAPLLGDLHPSLPRPSRNALARLARRHDLSEIRVFGSAVHQDFRPDSDIDILVRRRPGTRRTLVDQAHLTRELEDLFDREVDVLDAEVLRPEVAERAQAEGVTIYG